MRGLLSLALLIIVLLSTIGFASAEDAQTYWIESLGDSGWLRLNAVTQLADGSIIAVGWIAKEKYNGDLLVVKFSPYGTVEWAKSYGGSGDDYATGVAIGPNGDIIVVGATQSYGAGSYDVWVLRLYPDGRVRWQKTYGGSGDDRGMAVAIGSDGKIVVVGGTTSYGANPGDSSDLWVLKLGGTGDVVWSKTYGMTKWDWGNAVAVDEANNIYIGGVYWLSVEAPYDSFGSGGDGWILKLDTNGNLVWNYLLGGVDNDWISGIGLVEGDIVFSGSTKSFGAGEYDIWVGRITQSGELLWAESYGGAKRDVGTSLTVFNPSCAFLVGYTYSYPGSPNSKAWVLGFSPGTGRAEWQKIYGGPGSDHAFGVFGSSTGFIAVGSTSSFGQAQTAAWIIRLQISGAIFKDSIRDMDLVSDSFKGWTYPLELSPKSPNIEPLNVEPSVSDSTASPVEVLLPIHVQYYYGTPPATTTPTTTTSTSTTTTSTSTTPTTTTTSTATTTTTTTTTVITTTTSTVTSPTSTSTLPTSTTTPSSSSSGGGGICGPGLMVLLGVGVLAARRRF